MHGVLDGLLVGLALLASVLYAAIALGPRGLRRSALLAASVLLRKLPNSLHLRTAALRLAAAAQKAGGTCGGCDSCDSSQPAAKASPSAPASTDIRIPVSSIRRR